MQVDNKEITVSGGFIKTASLKAEWYEDIGDPAAFLDRLKAANVNADIFTRSYRDYGYGA